MSSLTNEAGLPPVAVGEVNVVEQPDRLTVQMGRARYPKRFNLFPDEERQLRVILNARRIKELILQRDEGNDWGDAEERELAALQQG